MTQDAKDVDVFLKDLAALMRKHSIVSMGAANEEDGFHIENTGGSVMTVREYSSLATPNDFESAITER